MKMFQNLPAMNCVLRPSVNAPNLDLKASESRSGVVLIFKDRTITPAFIPTRNRTEAMVLTESKIEVALISSYYLQSIKKDFTYTIEINETGHDDGLVLLDQESY